MAKSCNWYNWTFWNGSSRFKIYRCMNRQFFKLSIDTARIYHEQYNVWKNCSLVGRNFSMFGNPNQIVSDNRPQFVSYEFVNFLPNRGISHCRTAVYTPQQNSEVECFNRTVKKAVQAFAGELDTKRKIKFIFIIVQINKSRLPEAISGRINFEAQVSSTMWACR